MAVELHGVGAAQQEVGDHEELRDFQGPDRRLERHLAQRGVEQHPEDGEDQIHGAATDPAVDPLYHAHIPADCLVHEPVCRVVPIWHSLDQLRHLPT
ncbi:hypothetical protein D3C78_1681750 [compost metagenome]